MIFGKEVRESFVGEILHGSARVFGEQVERKPKFGRKFDQLAFDVARMLAKEHLDPGDSRLGLSIPDSHPLSS